MIENFAKKYLNFEILIIFGFLILFLLSNVEIPIEKNSCPKSSPLGLWGCDKNDIH